LTFTDWGHYTDDSGRSCTLNWTATTGLIGRPHLEALRQAIVERYRAAQGSSVPSALASPLPAGMQRLYTPLRSVFQSTLTGLIPSFINHNDSGGDWDGDATRGPHWTEAGVLADIGAGTVRLAQTLHGEDLAVWALQQRLIINRLLWTAPWLGLIHQSNTLQRIAMPVANWPTATWQTTSNQYIAGARYLAGGTSAAWRTSAVLDIGSYAGAPTHDCDLYAHGEKAGTAYEWSDQASGLSLIENCYVRVGSYTGLSGAYPITLGHIEDVPPDAPVSAQYRGFRIAGFYGVMKWDVSGGFTFK